MRTGLIVASTGGRRQHCATVLYSLTDNILPTFMQNFKIHRSYKFVGDFEMHLCTGKVKDRGLVIFFKTYDALVRVGHFIMSYADMAELLAKFTFSKWLPCRPC